MAKVYHSKTSLGSRRRFFTQCAALGLSAGASSRLAAAVSLDENKPLVVGTAAQLFLDDFVIERIDGLARRFH